MKYTDLKLSYYPKLLPYAVLNFYPQFIGHNMNRILNGPGVAGHFYSLLTDHAAMHLIFDVHGGDTKKNLDWLADEMKKGYGIERRIYSKKEVLKQPYKEGVRLLYFRGDPDKPFLIFNPCGAFLMDANICDALSMARECVARGYNFFIINYSQCIYPFHGGFRSARQDLSKALDYIMKSDLPLNKEGFAITGGSAGGFMTCLCGSDNYGCKAMGDPVPAALIALYPVCATENVIEKAMLLGLSRPGCVYNDMNPALHVASDCPPIFYWRGGQDLLVCSASMKKYEEALKAKNIPYEFHQYKDGKHGCGLGTDKDPEGWLDDALRFWETHR